MKADERKEKKKEGRENSKKKKKDANFYEGGFGELSTGASEPSLELWKCMYWSEEYNKGCDFDCACLFIVLSKVCMCECVLILVQVCVTVSLTGQTSSKLNIMKAGGCAAKSPS